MELKHPTNVYLHSFGKLLIVPYGIETQYPLSSYCTYLLLIVPYGIETPNRSLQALLHIHF